MVTAKELHSHPWVQLWILCKGAMDAHFLHRPVNPGWNVHVGTGTGTRHTLGVSMKPSKKRPSVASPELSKSCPWSCKPINHASAWTLHDPAEAIRAVPMDALFTSMDDP